MDWGGGANEAFSTASQRERLSWEEAGIFRETVAAGITKDSYQALENERDEAVTSLARRLDQLTVASGIINSGKAIDIASGWITVRERSIVDSQRYETLTCEQLKEPDSIQLAAARICGTTSVVDTEVVYQVSNEECSATLITVTCAQ